jgi:TRAP transporter TAXI family solute receptor
VLFRSLLKIGTAGSGGTYYYVGSAVSAVVNKYVPEVRMNPEATAGGLENMRRMASRQLDFAMVAPADFVKVKADKTSGPDKVNFVQGIHSTVQHFLVRADQVKGAKSVKEWLKKGVKMGVGEPGSSVQSSNQVLLKVFGMTLEDIEAHKISQAESAEAFKDGVISAMFLGGGVPLASITDATQSVEAVLLPFTEDDIKKFQQVAAYQFGYPVPANTYRGQTKEVYTVAYPPMLMTRSDIDPEIVYKVIKAIHDHTAELSATHPAGREWVLSSTYRGADWANSFGYKFHPGMVKYLKEKNSWNTKYEK